MTTAGKHFDCVDCFADHSATCVVRGLGWRGVIVAVAVASRQVPPEGIWIAWRIYPRAVLSATRAALYGLRGSGASVTYHSNVLRG